MPGDNEFVIEIPKAQVDAAMGLLDPRQKRQALYQAIKRSASRGKTFVSATLREQSLAKKKYLDRGINARMGEGDIPTATIAVSDKKIPLIAFQYSASRKGVRVRMDRDKGPQWFSHAFVTTVYGEEGTNDEGHKGIFTRASHLPTRGPNMGTAKLVKGTDRPARFAIRQLYGPSAFATVKNPRVFKKITDGLGQIVLVELQKNLASQQKRFAVTA